MVEPKKASNSMIAYASFPSPVKLLGVHLTCGLGLVSAFWVASNLYSFALIQNPVQTLLITWVAEASVVIPLYSLFRFNPDQCSYIKAVMRGLLSLPAGALINALGAIVLGAPIGIQYFTKTVNWSMLMSVFTFAPAACVYGASWNDGHRILSHTDVTSPTDYMISLPAYGSVIGAWFGAWPMPLDWERPWQEWPISVTYGAVAGYFVGMTASVGFGIFRNRLHQKGKED